MFELRDASHLRTKYRNRKRSLRSALRRTAFANVVSSRPDFFALVYPAIPKDMVPFKDMAPAFLACGENDRLNIAQGLPELYLKIKQAGASAELHVYSNVGHGFGLRPTLKGPVATWIDRFYDWMGAKGFLARS